MFEICSVGNLAHSYCQDYCPKQVIWKRNPRTSAALAHPNVEATECDNKRPASAQRGREGQFPRGLLVLMRPKRKTSKALHSRNNYFQSALASLTLIQKVLYKIGNYFVFSLGFFLTGVLKASGASESPGGLEQKHSV